MKAKADVLSGVCGFRTQVVANLPADEETCTVCITSDCPHVTKLSAALTTVQPFAKGGFAAVKEAAAQHCRHAGCPVAVAVIKTVEIAAGLALPADVTIKLEKVEE